MDYFLQVLSRSLNLGLKKIFKALKLLDLFEIVAFLWPEEVLKDPHCWRGLVEYVGFLPTTTPGCYIRYRRGGYVREGSLPTGVALLDAFGGLWARAVEPCSCERRLGTRRTPHVPVLEVRAIRPPDQTLSLEIVVARCSNIHIFGVVQIPCLSGFFLVFSYS